MKKKLGDVLPHGLRRGRGGRGDGGAHQRRPPSNSDEGGVDWMRECCFLHGLVGGERKERERVFCGWRVREKAGRGS